MSSSSTRERNHLLWIGPLLALGGLLSYFLYFYRFASLRDFPWVNLPLVLAGAVAAGLGTWRAYAHSDRFRGKILGPLSLVVSLAVAGLFVGYVFFLSYELPDADAAIGLVEAPDFELVDQQGRPVRLSDLRGSKVVLVFYRGFW